MKDARDETRAAFNHAAPLYDDSFESLPGVQRLRSIVHAQLLRHFQRGQRILELNCGTGTDAVALASKGINVHATDASEAMVHVASSKIAASRFDNLVTTEVLSFENLHRIGNSTYDGAFSNLGGLNCIPRLDSFAHSLSAIIRPSGIVILVIMPDFSLWEMLAFGLRGKFADAFRRRNRNGVSVGVHGHNVSTYYHSPRAVKRAFAPSFRHVYTVGLNVFTPPPSSIKAHKTLGKSLKILERLENVSARHFPFNRLGDHFLMVLQKVQSEGKREIS